MDYHINLGTAGWGVWHSPDAGKVVGPSSQTLPTEQPDPGAGPSCPASLAGSWPPATPALFQTHDGGKSWEDASVLPAICRRSGRWPSIR
jgi:hypothetical protein